MLLTWGRGKHGVLGHGDEHDVGGAPPRPIGATHLPDRRGRAALPRTDVRGPRIRLGQRPPRRARPQNACDVPRAHRGCRVTTDARDARSPTTKLAPDRQPLGRIIGRKRSDLIDVKCQPRQLTRNTCKPLNCDWADHMRYVQLLLPLTCQSGQRTTFRLHFAFFGAAF